MNHKDILNDLKAGRFSPVYFLMGDEPYYIDMIANYVAEKVIPEDMQDFNRLIVYGRDANLGDVIGECRQLPMMHDKRVVVIREAQDIRKMDDLEPYFSAPNPATILVVCYKNKKLDKRSKAYKTLSKSAVVFESKKMYDSQLPDWINNYVTSAGKSINVATAQLMAEYVGNDLERLAREVSKLNAVVPDGQTITSEIVEKYVGISKEYNVFELQKALGMRDVEKANRIVNYFASNPKSNPLVVVLSSLYNYFSKVMIYHFAPDKNPRTIAGLLKVNPFFVKDYQLAAQRYNQKKIAKIFSHLRDCDVRSKGIDNVSTTDGELLRELVYKIIH